jgi:hypothetical protein
VLVTSSANPSNTKQSVAFTAAVTPASATGTVQFLDGAAVLGSATITNGSASFSPASLSQGTTPSPQTTPAMRTIWRQLPPFSPKPCKPRLRWR